MTTEEAKKELSKSLNKVLTEIVHYGYPDPGEIEDASNRIAAECMKFAEDSISFQTIDECVNRAREIAEKKYQCKLESVYCIMDKPKRVYISGPISGHDLEQQRKKFKAVQERLESIGYETFNPMENGLPADSSTAQHMRRDLSKLCREEDPFDTIYMMSGWTHSKGCKTEFDCATVMGMSFIFEDILNTLGIPTDMIVTSRFK